MKIHQVYTYSNLRNFSYLIELESCFYCIDPWDGEQIRQLLDGKMLKAIINTHEHSDHTRGNSELYQNFKVPVWGHPRGEKTIPHFSRGLKEGEVIPLENDCSLEVWDTPGHTFAHLCLLIKEKNNPVAVLTGDTLFGAGVGNCHNGGDPKILYKTLKEKFFDLPDHVILYPGHEYLENNLSFALSREPDNLMVKKYLGEIKDKNEEFVKRPTCFGEEKKINPFFRLNSNTIISQLGESSEEDERQVFLSLRKLRDLW